MEESLTFILLILFLGMNSHEHFAKANALRLFCPALSTNSPGGIPFRPCVYMVLCLCVYIMFCHYQ